MWSSWSLSQSWYPACNEDLRDHGPSWSIITVMVLLTNTGIFSTLHVFKGSPARAIPQNKLDGRQERNLHPHSNQASKLHVLGSVQLAISILLKYLNSPLSKVWIQGFHEKRCGGTPFCLWSTQFQERESSKSPFCHIFYMQNCPFLSFRLTNLHGILKWG